MKKLTNVSLIALSLVALFATAGFAAETSADEYEFTALYNDVVIEFPSDLSHEDCNRYAALQNSIDLTLSVLEYDLDINDSSCSHPDQAQKVAAKNINRILEDISFDG